MWVRLLPVQVTVFGAQVAPEMVVAQLGNQDAARKWYGQAVEWTDKTVFPNKIVPAMSIQAKTGRRMQTSVKFMAHQPLQQTRAARLRRDGSTTSRMARSS